jgi:hypothetical protein
MKVYRDSKQSTVKELSYIDFDHYIFYVSGWPVLKRNNGLTLEELPGKERIKGWEDNCLIAS